VSLRRLPFFRVLHRPNLFLGGERGPALMTLIACAGLAVTGMNAVAIGTGAVLWFVSIPLLRWMAKADHQMFAIYRRHIRYKGYHPARSRPYAGDTMNAALQWALLIGPLLALCLFYAYWRGFI
jgi:type IV secretory pathway TrbD component